MRPGSDGQHYPGYSRYQGQESRGTWHATSPRRRRPHFYFGDGCECQCAKHFEASDPPPCIMRLLTNTSCKTSNFKLKTLDFPASFLEDPPLRSCFGKPGYWTWPARRRGVLPSVDPRHLHISLGAPLSLSLSISLSLSPTLSLSRSLSLSLQPFLSLSTILLLLPSSLLWRTTPRKHVGQASRNERGSALSRRCMQQLPPRAPVVRGLPGGLGRSPRAARSGARSRGAQQLLRPGHRWRDRGGGSRERFRRLPERSDAARPIAALAGARRTALRTRTRTAPQTRQSATPPRACARMTSSWGPLHQWCPEEAVLLQPQRTRG